MWSAAAALLDELVREVALTRRVLERLPDQPDWRPHPRSRSLGELAGHLLDVLGYARNLIETPGYDFADATGHHRPHQGRDALLAAFDAAADRTRRTLAAATDATLLERWRLSRGREELFTAPRALVVRRFLLNHLVHHRGQLLVYLRMLEVALPAIYGPSADEP